MFIITCTISWSAAGMERGSAGLSSFPPSPDRLQHPHQRRQKMWYLVVACSPLCNCGSRDADVESTRQGLKWRASLWEGDKRVAAKKFSKTLLLPSSSLNLFLVLEMQMYRDAWQRCSLAWSNGWEERTVYAWTNWTMTVNLRSTRGDGRPYGGAHGLDRSRGNCKISNLF